MVFPKKWILSYLVCFLLSETSNSGKFEIMKKTQEKNETLILQIFITVVALLFGGFYEFVSCLATIGFGVYLFWITHRRKEICLFWNSGIILAIVLLVCHGLAVLWAVDSGMAFLGFLKFMPIVLFVLILMQFTEEERNRLLLSVPVSGIIIIAIGILFYWVLAVREHFFMAGRFGGTFQYSNTMALYFLAGIVVIQNKITFSIKTAAGTVVLLLGILMTGSRSVFVMTVFLMAIEAWKNRGYRLLNVGLLTVSVVGGGIYGAVTGNFQNFGRFLTISLENSTFIGRLLYWRDAFWLILRHPMGNGYMGYYYSQGQIQTGVYSTVFVHNDFLQIVLDVGWIPAILAAGVLIKHIFFTKIDVTAKMILFLIGVHSLLDFDMQFLSICLLFFMVLEYNGGEGCQVKAQVKRAVYGITAAGVAISLYFLFPLASFYRGEYELARKLYPYYTEAELVLLQEAQTKEEGETLADSILKRNQNAALAYDAKALACAMEEDFEGMVQYKEMAVKNNPYAIYEYVDYVSLLSRAVEYYSEKNDVKIAKVYVNQILELPDRLEDMKKRTSELGWRIKDQPELVLPKEVEDYISNLQ